MPLVGIVRIVFNLYVYSLYILVEIISSYVDNVFRNSVVKSESYRKEYDEGDKR